MLYQGKQHEYMLWQQQTAHSPAATWGMFDLATSVALFLLANSVSICSSICEIKKVFITPKWQSNIVFTLYSKFKICYFTEVKLYCFVYSFPQMINLNKTQGWEIANYMYLSRFLFYST